MKTRLYTRLRQYFPVAAPKYPDDRDQLDGGEIIQMDWPDGLKKPEFGLVKDYGPYPRWTKYRRFLENNGFEYRVYDLHAHDWLEKVRDLDIVVGFISSEYWDLQEMREKYFFLEKFLGKRTYPSPAHVNLYENKRIEAYVCQSYGFPFARTHLTHDKKDALCLIKKLNYPIVSKIVPASGSMGVELVRDLAHARKIVEQAFSANGRKSHLAVFRQKNYIYFQDFIPNHGYDLRAIVVKNWIFGYGRKVLKGDFRASGMNQTLWGDLPAEAMQIALKLNEVVKSPMLAVDMVHGLDGKYHVVEFSPICQIDTPEQLYVDGIPGRYVFDGQSFQFQQGRYWIQELALREFLLNEYVPAQKISLQTKMVNDAESCQKHAELPKVGA
jgi:glutathione synthase/RimK-type ligase-like ATP-grasp enzyme